MRIVVASSDKAYGTAPRLPYDESMPLNGRHPYDASKSCTDIIAQTYHHSYGLPVCITRAGNFFGGRDLNFNRIVPGVARWAINGERPVLRSDGGMIRDYIYVRDVVLAYLARWPRGWRIRAARPCLQLPRPGSRCRSSRWCGASSPPRGGRTSNPSSSARPPTRSPSSISPPPRRAPCSLVAGPSPSMPRSPRRGLVSRLAGPRTVCQHRRNRPPV